MSVSLDELGAALDQLQPGETSYATEFVEQLIAAAQKLGASDAHLQPVRQRLDVRLRLDGVLCPVGEFSRGQAADVVSRLKVLAGLLTYRADLPQEGRIRRDENDANVEIRVSTFPTLYGERAVIRFFAAKDRLLYLDDLGLPEEIAAELARLLSETSGAVILTGPAGSGKTTTIYACLREIQRQSQGQRSIVTLEDPIEAALPGAAQSQVNEAAGFDLATGLRSLMRQDPEVVMIGEIRDPPTAEAALGASLTGHLVLTTFHAGSAAGAVSRLADMGLEPYLLRSGVLAILCQRLARRLCECAQEAAQEEDRLGLPVERCRTPVGCPACGQTGYRGRLVLAEMLTIPEGDRGRAILSRGDAGELERLALESGMVSRWRRAREAVERGFTSPAEVRRVLGFSAAVDLFRG